MELKQKIGLNLRPFWKEALTEIKQEYVIIVYTASHQSYADSVLDYLDPNKELIQYRLYRNNCVKIQSEGDYIYIKDLRIFKNVDIKDIVIVDNSILSFAFQLENGIPILPYYDAVEDNELNYLVNYLKCVSLAFDLREENNKSIKMKYFLNVVKEEENSLLDLQLNDEEEDDGSKMMEEEVFTLKQCSSRESVKTNEENTPKNGSSTTKSSPLMKLKNNHDRSLSLMKMCLPQRKETPVQNELKSTLSSFRNAYNHESN